MFKGDKQKKPVVKPVLRADDNEVAVALLKTGYVSDADLKTSLRVAKREHLTLYESLIGRGFVDRDLFGQAMSEYYKIPYADLNSNTPSRELVKTIPEDIAKRYRVVLFKKTTKGLVVTTDVPKQVGLLKKLKTILGVQSIFLNYSLSEDIDESLNIYSKSLNVKFSKIIEEGEHVAPGLIEAIVDGALMLHSSDIHFEPQTDDVLIRFRVDGVLQEAGRILKKYYFNILNRIKVQAHLRLDEHFAAQDGAIRYVGKNKKTADMRVSILPTVDGEKIVIRLLSQYVRQFTLSDLGLSAANQTALEAAAAKPFGMILVTGPTGSGKTTSLYALLKNLNKPEINITTIEDPVEYRLANVNQIQVNPKTDLTFAKGLRSIVRQDPDIILVGEVRDTETAEIAVNAALTGHLLFSTFHANDAATAVPRLLDMGIEPFLLASTLELVIAQRLVRRICDSCRHSYTIKKSEIVKKYETTAKYFTKNNLTLYKGKGCSSCNHTGYKGRIAIYEFIRVSSEMEALILKNPATQEIRLLADKQGGQTLFSDGMNKVKDGVTTIDEVMRVAGLGE